MFTFSFFLCFAEISIKHAKQKRKKILNVFFFLFSTIHANFSKIPKKEKVNIYVNSSFLDHSSP